MNENKSRGMTRILLIVVPAVLLVLTALIVVHERVIADHINVSIENSDKKAAQAVTLQWPQGKKEFTVAPGGTVEYTIRGVGENSILLHVKKTGKAHDVSGYLTGAPFGSIDVVLDSAGFVRSHSSTKVFIFDKPSVHDCGRKTCVIELPSAATTDH